MRTAIDDALRINSGPRPESGAAGITWSVAGDYDPGNVEEQGWVERSPPEGKIPFPLDRAKRPGVDL